MYSNCINVAIMDSIFQKVRSAGGRITKLRKAIIKILFESDCLLSRQEIIERLSEIHLHPDRSTLYREFLFLTQNNIVQKSVLNEAEYFEIPHDHHHHLVCLKCDDIQKVHLSQHLQEEEKEISAKNNFHITSHSLDFYGYCHKCQN